MSAKPQTADTADRLQRGLILALIGIVIVLVIVIAFRQLSGDTEQVQYTGSAASTGEVRSDGEVSQLLGQARQAVADSRLVTPAGDNAYEHYLEALAAQPDNVAAREAINDLYGIAVSSTEQAIGSGDFDDAQRMVGLLSQANPDSFTVINLRQRIERGLQAQAAAEAAATAAAVAQQAQPAVAQASTPDPASAPETPAAAPAPEPAVAEPASDLASMLPGSASSAPAASPPAQPAATPPSAMTTTTATAPTQTAPATPQVRDARLLSRVDPQYPPEAMRGRQQGWVELEFTVDVDGSISNVNVVASRPTRVFDRAAIRAMQEWRFDPRLENGEPVVTRMRQRFDFRLD